MADHVVEQLKSGGPPLRLRGPGCPGELPAGALDLAGEPARLVGQGQRVLPQAPAGHRLARCALTRRRRPVGRVTSSGTSEAPEGKLDLLLSLDFRQTSTTMFSDVVLPAATWYEKHDLNTTDMHPYVHSFNPAIAPPWQTRTDWDAFQVIATKFSELAATHLGTRRDVVAVPLLHDTPDEMANPQGVVKDWKAGECEPVPGRTMPKLVEVERDYARRGCQDGRAGPADGEARHDHQGRHLRRQGVGRLPPGARTAPSGAVPPTAARRSSATSTPARRSSRCPAPPTATSPSRGSRPWRSAPASSCTTWRPSTRASRSPSPTPRPRPRR